MLIRSFHRQQGQRLFLASAMSSAVAQIGTRYDFTGQTLPAPWDQMRRAGLGTLVDAAGNVGYAAHNLLLQSNSLSSASWVKTTSSAALAPVVTAGAGPGPAGIASLADLVVFDCADATNAANRSRIEQTVSGLASGVVHAVTLWVRAFEPADVGQTIRFSIDGVGEVIVTLSMTYQRVSLPSVAMPSASVTYLVETRGTVTSRIARALLSVARMQQGPDTGSATDAATITTTTARYLPRIAHDPALDVNGQPYTQVEQYGPERVANGDGSTLSGWTQVNDAGCTAVASGGQFVLTNVAASAARIRQEVPVTAGRTYRVELTASANNNPGSAAVQVWGTGYGSGVLFASGGVISGTVTAFVVATSSSLFLQLQAFNSSAGVTNTFDNISVREFLGVTTSSQPRVLGLMVEGQAVNRQSSNFANWLIQASGWTRNPGATTGMGGGPTDTFTESAGATQRSIYRAPSSPTSGATTFTIAFRKISGANRWMRVVIGSAAGDFATVTVNMQTGAIDDPVQTFGTASAASAMVTVTPSGWIVTTLTATLASAIAFDFLVPLDSATPGHNAADWDRMGYLGAGAVIALDLPQDVAGTVPTSYIPNPGTGTALRTGDFAGGGLTGAALSALLPGTPEVLGAELVTNGDFSAGSTGWQIDPGGTFSISAGVATKNSSTSATLFQTSSTIVAGRQYRATWTQSGATVNATRINIRAPGDNIQTSYNNNNGVIVETFIATASGQFGLFVFSAGVVIDNISVREVITPAVAGPQLPFTLILPFRKSYTQASVETLLGLCAGATAGGTNQLGIAVNGTQAQIVHSGGSGSLTGTLVLDGSTVNRIAVSVDPTAGRASISVNGSAAVETTGIAYTGAGVTNLVLGARDTAGGQPAVAVTMPEIRVAAGQYITGAALQALST